MSSRDTFVSNYLYHQEAVDTLLDKLENRFKVYKPTISSPQSPMFVSSMIKNTYWDHRKGKKVRGILNEVKEEHNIEYNLYLVFVTDEYPLVTCITTASQEIKFDLYPNYDYSED